MDKITMSSIRQKFPMYEDLSDDELLTALHQKHYADIPIQDFRAGIDFDTKGAAPSKVQSPEFQAKVAAQQQADRATYDPAKGANTLQFGPWDTGVRLSERGERGLENLGAGMHNLYTGAKQLAGKIGIGPGVGDEELKEKRARDEHLAKSLPYYAGNILQGLGEYAPSFAIPFAALPKTVGGLALGPTTRLLTGSALGGAASSTLTPVTSDESRTFNAGVGAGLGVILPGMASAGQGAVKKGLELFTKSAARQRAADLIAEHMGPHIPDFLRDVAGYKAPVMRGQPVDVPVSAVQASGDPVMAQLEAASRSHATSGPSWNVFDAAQNARRFQMLEEMTPSALRVERLKQAREAATRPLRETALAEAGQSGNFAEPVLQHVQDLVEGAKGANPAVTYIADYVDRVLGPNARGIVSPERLYEARMVLTEKLKGPATDELGAATKSAQAETMKLIRAIDDSLMQASGGKWRPYMDEFARRSDPVAGGQAMRDIYDVMSVKPYKGRTPEVTFQGLKRPVEKFGESKKFGDRFTPEQSEMVESLLEHLRSTEAPARLRKTSATMGGGSITNTDQQLAQAFGNLIERTPWVGKYAQRMRELTEFKSPLVHKQMAELLQNPEVLAPLLRNYVPPTP